MSLCIENQTFDEERALYHLQDATVRGCTFAGPADGESALKESHRIAVEQCHFSLRYPFWHATDFTLTDSLMDELTRAAIWYAADGKIDRCELNGIKCLRECDRMTLSNTTAHSPELGWKCRDVVIENCDITAEYVFLECQRATINQLTLHGKYSFQYAEDLTITDSHLDTKDAFWHAKNVTVKNSVVKGEYLGWYSDGLTLIGCRIIGTQPLCYCQNLTLIDCTMEDTDLSFEYSDVQADIRGGIESVKNPRSGRIVADEIGEIIRENAVMDTDCDITVRSEL